MIHVQVMDADVQALFVRLKATANNLKPLMQGLRPWQDHR